MPKAAAESPAFPVSSSVAQGEASHSSLLSLPHLGRSAPEELSETLSETLIWASRPGSRATCLVGRRIGSGGFAEVFEAELCQPARSPAAGPSVQKVALKRLLPSFRGDPLRQRQLRREAQIGAQLNHPNIARVLSLIELGSELGEEVALAMELLKGLQVNHLLHRLNGRGLRLRQPAWRQIASRLFAALLYLEDPQAHLPSGSGKRAAESRPRGAGRPIVHADISLENLMITESGEVKLIDFGIAAEDLSAASSDPLNDEALTSLHQVAGKRPYLPPEGMDRGGPSSQSDLYAAGVCCWELCTGCRFPVLPRGVSDREIGSLIAFAGRGQPEPLWQLLKSCLAVDPAQRMRSASQGLELLRRLALPDEESASPPSLGRLFDALTAAAPLSDELAALVEPQDYLPMLTARLRFAFCAERVQAFAPQSRTPDGDERPDRFDDHGGDDDVAREPPFHLRAESSEVAPDGEACDVALSALPAATQASLPSPARLREALNIGGLEDESGTLLFRVRPPSAGATLPAHVICVSAGAGASYDPMAQALLRSLLCPIPG